MEKKYSIFIIITIFICSFVLKAQNRDSIISLPINFPSPSPFSLKIKGKAYIKLSDDSVHINRGKFYVHLFFNEKKQEELIGFNIIRLQLFDNKNNVLFEYNILKLNITDEEILKIKPKNFYPKNMQNYYTLVYNFIFNNLLITRNYKDKFINPIIYQIAIKK